MSKIVTSISKGVIKTSVIGALLALVVYILLQMLSAFLIHRELVGEDSIWTVVFLSAGLSSFIGCLYSVLKRKGERVLTASTVVLVFLVLTVASALLMGGVNMDDNVLTGVGIAMAAGGLLAALISNGIEKKKGTGGRRSIKRPYRK